RLFVVTKVFLNPAHFSVRERKPPEILGVGRILSRELFRHRQRRVISVQRTVQIVSNLLHVADAYLQQRQAASSDAAGWIISGELFVQRERFAVTLERARGIAQILQSVMTQEIPELL